MEDKRITILYAEDEEILQKIVKYALERFGNYSVMTCDDGTQAVAAALKYRPDLIILDVMMPGKDGLTAFEEIRAIPEVADTPIVFMTARIQPDEVEVYRKIGAVNVIGKPFEPSHLPDIISEIWSNCHAGRDGGDAS